MPRSHVLDEIRTLDPERDHQRIVFLSCRQDFPFDTTRALELALFRTFCSPAVAELLDRTGEFRQRAQRRYDDTDIIVSELMEHGYDSPRGRAALRRMNQIHGRFAIGNEEFLYVLSTFVYEPIRWNARFGWRPLCEQERLALFYFWREVGRRMSIKDLPGDYHDFERFSRDYERSHFRYTEANHRVGVATREMFVRWVPLPLRPLARRSIHALLDDELIANFGFSRPSPALRRLVRFALRTRARILAWLPHRRRPLLRTEMKHPTYPRGYQVEKLGPETLGPPAPRNDSPV
jgi:hypothetical protein